jgi:hypothetical protein
MFGPMVVIDYTAYQYWPHYFFVDLLAWIEQHNLSWLSDLLGHVDAFGQRNCLSMISQFKSDCLAYGMNNFLQAVDTFIDDEQGQGQQIQEINVLPMEEEEVEEVEEIGEGDQQGVDDEIECICFMFVKGLQMIYLLTCKISISIQTFCRCLLPNKIYQNRDGG